MLKRIRHLQFLTIFVLLVTIQLAIPPISIRMVKASNLTFGGTLNLSNDATDSDTPVIASSGSYVYVAWTNINTLGNPEVFFVASSNGGASFGNPVKLGNATISANPQIAASGNNVYVVWQALNGTGSNEILLRTSNNNGASFQSIKDLSNDAGDSVSPAIAVSGNFVYVAFQDDVSGPTGSTDVFFSNSTNSGQSFHAKVNLSNDKHSQFPQIAAAGNDVYVAWRDLSSPPDEIYLKSSTNNGNSFHAPSTGINLSKSPTATSFQQQLAATGSKVYVTWTDDTPSTDDIFFAASINSGSSFGNPVNLSNNAASVNPSLAASGNNVYDASENHAIAGQSIISLGVSGNNGTSFASPSNLSSGFDLNPVVISVGSNVYVAWEDTGNNDVFFVSSDDNADTFGTIVNLSTNSGFSTLPVVAGTGSNAYVAWQDDTPGNNEVFFKTGAPPTALPDVAVTALNVSRTFAYSGVSAKNLTVTVTTMNLGNALATFTIGANATNTSTRANATIGSKQTVTNLGPGASQVLQFSWNTTPLSMGNYTITAYASTAAGETIFSNNVLSCPSSGTGCGWPGMFTSRLKGDVNTMGSERCLVDIVDLATVGGTFGKMNSHSGFNPAADLNNDGTTDIVDLVLVAGNFGQSVSPCPY